MTTLYRIYGPANSLLYVGITNDYEKRMAGHADKHWWRLVRRIETEEYKDRATATAAEREAIKEERPRYNRTHNGQRTIRHEVYGKRLISVAEAAEFLGVSTLTIRRYISRGLIRGYKYGRLIRIDAVELEDMGREIPTYRPAGDPR